MQNCNSRPKSASGKPKSFGKNRARSRGWRIIDLHRELDKIRPIKVRSFVEHVFDTVERDQWRRNLANELSVHTFVRGRR